MNNFLELVEDIGILPQVVLDNVADAVPLGEALVKGCIPMAKVSFRTEAAADIIEAMANNVPDLIVGAGTIHSVEEAKLAVSKGAKFIVTSGIQEDVVKWCTENNVVIIPGCVTPSDIELALRYDLKVVNFFPAEIFGGVKAIKALYGPYYNVKFLASGGIDESNLIEYLDQPNVAAVAGDFVLSQEAIANKDWEAISAQCIYFVHKVLGLSIGHVGINRDNLDAAWALTNELTDLFSIGVCEGESFMFVGDNLFEILKTPFHGDNGHIAINTNYIERAMKFFARRGIEYREETMAYDANGRLKVVYMTREMGGFAFHLRQNDKFKDQRVYLHNKYQ